MHLNNRYQNKSYLNIDNINSLKVVHDYLKSIRNKSSVCVFFDWDDTIIDPDTNILLEPKATKELFDYMVENRIFFSIITARFYNVVCSKSKRKKYLKDIYYNVVNTMHPILESLGLNVSFYQTPDIVKEPMEIINENGSCTGILYMGIFFSSKKGETIKNYLRMSNIKNKKILFIDDYEEYLLETTSSIQDVKAYRRFKPKIKNIFN